MNIKKLSVTTALAASLLIGAGATLAQEETPEAPTQQETPVPGGRWGGDFGGRPGGFQGGRGPRGGMRRLHLGAEFSALVEEYTGLTQEEIRAAFQEGQTLAGLIEANDQSVDDFLATAVEQASAQIDEAVAVGRITEARADEIKATLSERITAWVNGEHPVRQGIPGANPEAEATPTVEANT